MILTVNPGLLIASILVCLTALARAGEPERLFLDRVKPLLDSRCVSCHGTEKKKGGLRLDSRADALKGGDTGPAVVPGDPKASLLIQAVLHTSPDLGMPPKEKLTPADIAILEGWILQGAPWPQEASPAVTPAAVAGERIGDAWSDPRNPIIKIFGGQRLDLWSLKPLRQGEPPAVRRKPWPRQPVDRFILAGLEKARLSPAPEADRRTLARRVYLDLTGLPPTPEEMQRLLGDTRSGAYERLVDQLLASPRYGEHGARLWLDVIRYSDSNGFDWDEYRPRAWRFRDYVIRSLNADKAFDQFIREQLAGDELVKGAPKTQAEQDYLIATGFLRLGPHDNSAALFNEQDRSRAELMSDLVETTGSAFLGLSLGCCRCHDHKYDPLSQADHFRLRAFFEPVRFADDLPLDLEAEQAAIRKHNEEVEVKLLPAKSKRDALLSSVKERLRQQRVDSLSQANRDLLALPPGQRTGEKKGLQEAVEKKVDPSEKEILAALTAEEKKSHETLSKELETFKGQKRSFTLGMLMTDGAAAQVPPTRILAQGDYKQPRTVVVPGFPSVLDPNPANLRTAPNDKTTGRRLSLADWIVSPTNPLTARVLVNRVWQSHFGRGLVATPNDFGLAGSPPTHPELLDWLASDFIRNKWSLKHLHRTLLLSATYRQASVPASASRAAEVDAQNSLLWRQQLRRLTAEQLRDALFQVSGTLRPYAGGPAIWPELPQEVLQANPAVLDDNPEKTKGWYPSPPAESFVRSIYLIQKRNLRVPFLETFDQPENATSCARRNESTVAPQALSLLNSPLAIEAAKALAIRVEKLAGPQPAARVEQVFALALQRSPAPQEKEACLQLLKKQTLTELCRVVLNLNEFIYID